jgi:hypothetical protein
MWPFPNPGRTTRSWQQSLPEPTMAKKYLWQIWIQLLVSFESICKEIHILLWFRRPRRLCLVNPSTMAADGDAPSVWTICEPNKRAKTAPNVARGRSHGPKAPLPFLCVQAGVWCPNIVSPCVFLSINLAAGEFMKIASYLPFSRRLASSRLANER